MVGDFLEYTNRDHNWILDNLDIWQLKPYHTRIQAMKLKELKGQHLAFYQAQAGMGGVQFKNCAGPSDYWSNEILAAQESGNAIDQPEEDRITTEADLDNLMRMFGG